MRRHVLRNALVPTVAVIAVQIGYLFGGIIGVEKIFNYNGMGQLMLFAAQRKDIPMLTAGVLAIGIVYMVATLIADLDHRLDEPAHPPGRGTLMASPSRRPDPGRARGAPARVRNVPRHAARRSAPVPPAGFVIGIVIIIVWIICAVLGERFMPYDPFNDFFDGPPAARPEHWFGTDRLGRDVFSRVLVGARDVFIVAPPAALIGVVAGTLLGLIMGFYRGPSTTS